MKNIMTLILALATAFALNAQTTKGSVSLSLHNFSPFIGDATGLFSNTNMLGISFGSSKTKIDGVEDSEKTKNSAFGLNTSVHYFIIDNLSLGLNVNFANQKQTQGDGNDKYEYKNTLIMAGPELRYFIPASSKAKIWVGAGGSFGTAKSEFTDFPEDDPSKITRFGGNAGLAFFPNSNFSIDLGLGYNVFTVKDEYINSLDALTKRESTASGLTLDLGFSAYF